ncbi:MAG: type 4a pilus biogenesis protein PilO [Elusimicrobia bacterium]|nr:type 4a pilus biogenesis protein PilO [Elusimicrobiota bacterium]
MTNKIKQQLVFILLIFVGAGFCYFNYILQPLDKKYNEAAIKLNQVETKLAELKIRAMELPKLKAEMESLQKEVAVLEKLLPQNKEIPGLLRTIARKAQRYNLQINVLTPAKIAPMEHYNELPFQVNLRGKYHPLAHFLADIGQEMRLMSVRSVNMNYSGSTDKNDTLNIVSDFTLIAYTYKE